MNPQPDPNFQPAYMPADETKERDAIRLNLCRHLRDQWQIFRNHASTTGVKQSLLDCLLVYNGSYSPTKLNEIRSFGGSEVYARLSTVKCRGATSMLRDVFLGAKRPWDIEPTPVPEVPDTVNADIETLVRIEATTLMQAGQQVDAAQLAQRKSQLLAAAQRASVKMAVEQAKKATLKLDDLLREGGFYEALGEFLVDLPIFKFAAIKGPVVRQNTDIGWNNGVMQVMTQPKMTWVRVNPFYLYFSPGAACIADSDVIEKCKVSRSDLSSLLGLPGYDEEALRAALDDYDHGLVDFIDDMDNQEAEASNRENPHFNQSNLIDMLEYHGKVQGKLLLDYGFTKEQIADALRDYTIDAWLVGQHLIKVQLSPNPKKRHPYYVTSYEKVPGSIIGHGLIELVSDIQDVANASLRSLVNNMSMSSGPQVAINEDRISPTTNADTLYPWKRWRFRSDPMQNNAEKPVDFFQPQSNAQELLGVYKAMTDIADEISAIPRYITGSEKVGGAASTASGLSMLMGNASKVLQNVAAQIDTDISKPALDDLYVLVMLTDQSGTLRGDENIVVKGVAVAIQKETDRMRRLEFLQITGNPLDLQITGLEGRAALLRALADDLGMPNADVVPSEEELRSKLEQQAIIAQQQQRAETGAAQDADAIAAGQAPPAAQGNPAPKPGSGRGRMASSMDNMHRTHVEGER